MSRQRGKKAIPLTDWGHLRVLLSDPPYLRDDAAALRSPAIHYALRQRLFPENKSLADATCPGPPGFLRQVGFLTEALGAGALALLQRQNPLDAAVKAYIQKRYVLQEAWGAFEPVRAIGLPDLALSSPNEGYNTLFSILHHHWPHLIRQTPAETRNSLIPLPFPYVVPGGRFSELYYWDSYFTLLGLKASRLDGLALGMVENFLYLMDTQGIIPNGNRTYYLSRSQPPFLTQMIAAVAPPDDAAWLERAFTLAKREYAEVWMNPTTHWVRPEGLNRYYDPTGWMRPEGWGTDNIATPNTESFFRHERSECESGWDFTDRFDGRCADFLPVDLNCLLYQYERDFAAFAQRLGDSQQATAWKQQARQRKRQIQRRMWDEADGLFYDIDTRTGQTSGYACLAAYYPLWAGLATTAQAQRLVENLSRFAAPGGLLTSQRVSGKQWDAPNGWAPLQWIVLSGLKRYGYTDIARQWARTWLDLCTECYEGEGKFFEKYNVVERNAHTPGSYPLQDGFGWTNAVCLCLLTDILDYPVETRENVVLPFPSGGS